MDDQIGTQTTSAKDAIAFVVDYDEAGRYVAVRKIGGREWPSSIRVAQEFAQRVPASYPGFFSTGDGMLRITCSNADALYGLVRVNDREKWDEYELIRSKPGIDDEEAP